MVEVGLHRLDQELEGRATLLRTWRHYRPDSFQPTVTRFAPRPLRHQPVDDHEANRLLGQVVGATDELGFYPAEEGQRMHVHDLQATILRQLGLDHLKLAYRFQGRDFRLTDVGGNVVGRLVGLILARNGTPGNDAIPKHKWSESELVLQPRFSTEHDDLGVQP